jgi:hypothetical protein
MNSRLQVTHFWSGSWSFTRLLYFFVSPSTCSLYKQQRLWRRIDQSLLSICSFCSSVCLAALTFLDSYTTTDYFYPVSDHVSIFSDVRLQLMRMTDLLFSTILVVSLQSVPRGFVTLIDNLTSCRFLQYEFV